MMRRRAFPGHGPDVDARYQRSAQWLLAAVYGRRGRELVPHERRAAGQGGIGGRRLQRRLPGADRSRQGHPRYPRFLWRIPAPRPHRADGVRQHHDATSPRRHRRLLHGREFGIDGDRRQRRCGRPDRAQDRLADRISNESRRTPLSTWSTSSPTKSRWRSRPPRTTAPSTAMAPRPSARCAASAPSCSTAPTPRPR
jgi:hypothetical protein